MTWTATGRRTTRAGVAALAAALLLAGCQVESQGEAGDDSSPAPTTEQTGTVRSSEPTTAPQGTVVEVTVEGDTIDPAGERVQVTVGEPVTFRVTADRAGELHVHSSPEEQEIAFEPGTHTYEIAVEQPGIIEVESHEPHQLVVQLEAR